MGKSIRIETTNKNNKKHALPNSSNACFFVTDSSLIQENSNN
jgi:hypothetical protein